MEMKKCRKCGLMKPLTEFHNCITCADKRKGSCRKCDNAYNRMRRKLGDENSYIKMTGVGRNDYCAMFELLSKMGYDPTISIHEQFCQKHNLPTKTRRDRDKNSYSFDDC